jgi:Trk K+ transport system NAD-binding subunit
MALASIEQDIPVHELLHLAQLKGGELELLEAQIADDSPAVGRRASDIPLPEGCSLFVLLRGNTVQAIKAETVLQSGDTVLAVARAECESDLRRQLIGDGEPVAGAAAR